jgi:hypothetical protein
MHGYMNVKYLNLVLSPVGEFQSTSQDLSSLMLLRSVISTTLYPHRLAMYHLKTDTTVLRYILSTSPCTAFLATHSPLNYLPRITNRTVQYDWRYYYFCVLTWMHYRWRTNEAWRSVLVSDTWECLEWCATIKSISYTRTKFFSLRALSHKLHKIWFLVSINYSMTGRIKPSSHCRYSHVPVDNRANVVQYYEGKNWIEIKQGMTLIQITAQYFFWQLHHFAINIKIVFDNT